MLASATKVTWLSVKPGLTISFKIPDTISEILTTIYDRYFHIFFKPSLEDIFY